MATATAEMSDLGIHYELREGHKLLGRPMPDLDLVTANGPLRVFTLLHDARPVLLNLGEPGGLDISPWGGSGPADRRWTCWYVGAAPAAVLIRLPRRIHAAGADCRHRLPEQGRRLRSLVQGFLADNAHDCGRSQAPGRQDRLHLGAPHLGLRDDPEPSLKIPGIIISLIFSEQRKLVFRASPLRN
jgi:hypothetical protein